MRRTLGNVAGAAGFLIASSWACSALADDDAVVDHPTGHHEDLLEKFFSKPTFLAMGPIASLANPEARGTLGGEVTLNRWLGDTLFTPGAGGYLQWEYVAGNQTRTSFGSQINYGMVGIETGYAYQTLQENRRNVHSLQVTPFISSGTWYLGVRTLAPFTSGAPLTCMMVLGLKVPISVGKKLDLGYIPHLWIH
jgi:hypothetical protein